MRMRLIPVLTAACVAAACALPERDNPFDPLNSPIAALAVVARGDGAACTPAVSPAGWETIASASRGRCIALDARQSLTPREGALAYEWFHVVGGVASPIPLDPDTGVLVEPTSGLAVLSRPFVLGLSTADLSVFAVAVEDDAGVRRTAEASLLVTNSLPVAVAPPERRFPLGGPPWAPQPQWVIPFDGSASADPDGDPIALHRWRFSYPDGHEDVVETTDATTSITVPSGVRAIVRARLEVSDGTVWSRPAFTVAEVDSPNLWTTDEAGLFEVSRIDAARHAVPVPTPTSVPADMFVRELDGASPPKMVIGAFRASPGPTPKADVYLVPFPSATPAAPRLTTTVPGNGGRIFETSPSGRSVWVGGGFANGTAKIQRLDLSQDETQLVVGADVTLNPSLFPFGGAADGLDRFWFTGQTGVETHIAAIEGTSQIEVMTTTSLNIVRLAARPETDEMWALVRPSGANTGDAALMSWTAPGATPTVRSLPDVAWYDMVWASRDELWIVRAGDGVRLLDVTLLPALPTETGEPDVELATIAHAEILETLQNMVADPLRRRLWADNFGTAWSVREDGSFTVLSGFAQAIQTLDHEGSFWFGSQQFHARGLTPLSTGVVARTPRTGDLTPQVWPDVLEGGVWKITDDAVLLYSQDGQVRRRETKVEVGGVVRSILPTYTSAVSPDGRWLWMYDNVGGGSFYAYDLAFSPPKSTTSTILVPGVGAIDKQLNRVGPPAAPGTGTPFTWIMLGDGSSAPAYNYLATVATDGTYDLRFTFPAIESNYRDPVVARSPLSNDVCAVSGDSTSVAAGTLYVRIIPSTGAVSGTPIGTVAIPANTVVEHVATSSDNGMLVCWAGYYLPPVTTCTGGSSNFGTFAVRAFRSDGVLLRSRDFAFTQPPQFNAMAPDSDSTGVWVSARQQTSQCADAQNRLVHYEFLTNATTALLSPDVSGLKFGR